MDSDYRNQNAEDKHKNVENICFKITDLLYYLILINISIIKTSNFLKEYKLYITKLYNI